MALRSKSLFNYGQTVTVLNRSIDFRATLLGPVLQANLRLGFYSLSGLMTEWARAMQEADPDHEYTLTADRTITAGLENRVTITTDGTYLDLLFLTGPRTTSNAAALIGFNTQDFTGALTYTGSFSSGTVLIPSLIGYNFLAPPFDTKFFGTKNVAASGLKETVTFAKQFFTHVQYMHEPATKIIAEWVPFMDWANQQRAFEWTPEISMPSVFYNVTMEKTEADSNGMAQRFKEMLPNFPFFHDTGQLTMRLENT